MKKIILSYLFISSTIIFGQGMHNSNRTGFLNPMQYDGLYLPISQSDQSNEGNIYLFPKWEGRYEVYVTEKKGYSLSNLNYNVKTNILESKISKDSVFQFDIDKINFIKHDSKKYKLYKIRETNELFQEIYLSDNVLFLKGFNVVLKKGTINPLTLEYIQKDKYSINEKFYLKLNNKNFIELSLNKKDILKLMEDKSSRVEKYASDFKLSFKSEIDLFKIFQYYDTL
jgi:hypothetical protein